MSSIYYDSQLTAEEIENALEAIDGVIDSANNGKILAVENGVIVAKSVTDYTDAPVLEPLSVTSNGDYTPGSGVDGFNSVHVNVSGGGSTLISKTITQNGTYNAASDNADGYSSVTINVSGGGGVFAFVECVFVSGLTVTATDGTTVLTSDTSGDFVFAIPSSGSWTFSDGTTSKSLTIDTYGSRNSVTLMTEAVRIWTKSTGGSDAAMYVQYGTYNQATGIFNGTQAEESVPYTTVRVTEKQLYGLATLAYNASYTSWVVQAAKDVSDGTNTYAAGDTVKTWSYSAAVDFVVYEV